MSKAKPLTLDEVQDMVRCAQWNLENLAKSVPLLELNRFYKIVHMQLSWALGEESRYDPDAPTESAGGS